jgi:hypothetical protein
MCQIVDGREHRYTLPKLLWEVSKISRHEPCARVVRQRQEQKVFRVWPTIRPLHGIGKAHAFFYEELQPERRKPESVKLGASYDGTYSSMIKGLVTQGSPQFPVFHGHITKHGNEKVSRALLTRQQYGLALRNSLKGL